MVSTPEHVIEKRKAERRRKFDNLQEDVDELKSEIREIPGKVEKGNPHVADAVNKLINVLELYGERVDELEEEVY